MTEKDENTYPWPTLVELEPDFQAGVLPFYDDDPSKVPFAALTGKSQSILDSTFAYSPWVPQTNSSLPDVPGDISSVPLSLADPFKTAPLDLTPFPTADQQVQLPNQYSPTKISSSSTDSDSSDEDTK